MLPVIAPLQGQVLGPEDGATIFYRAHPFKPEQSVDVVPAGSTVAEAIEIVTSARGEPRMAHGVAASIEGTYVPREMWDRVRLKPGVELEIRAVPGKGMGNILRSVLLVAVAIAAAAIGGPLAGIILGSAATGITTVALGAAITGAVTAAGVVACSVPFPTRSPCLPSR